MKTKIIAYYLPQYHRIPENDYWWGNGFTEWNNVKKSKKLFKNHYQPRIPLKNNYYDLSDVKVMGWQAKIAKEYGLYGFCFYHYWFDNKPLLEKPIINFLNEKKIDFNYCLCWANESWRNSWAKADDKIIMEQKYGERKEWKKHFDFLLPFFKDTRYIKEDNCPLLVVYRPYLCEYMIHILDYWKKLARENGFDGLHIASQRFEEQEKHKDLYDYLDYHIDYLSKYMNKDRKKDSNFVKVVKQVHNFVLDKWNFDIFRFWKKRKVCILNYDNLWNKIINDSTISEKSIAGGFVDWDNTPRYGMKGTVVYGGNPEKFEYYMRKQNQRVKNLFKNDYLFIFAWNEWGEGGYLEPDEKNKFAYLEALKKVISERR